MGVSNYTGDILYMEEDKPAADGDTLASIFVDRQYLKATIKIYPVLIKKWKETGDEIIEDTIAHETAHILTDQMNNLILAPYKNEGEAKDAWESLTQSIANISIKLDRQLKNVQKWDRPTNKLNA